MSAIDRASPPIEADRRQARNDEAAAERYHERQRQARRGRNRAGGSHPLEYDANGFPVPQRNSSFVRRVARLLNPL
jgi:hypothetical protein